jgi:hypothetical protein
VNETGFTVGYVFRTLFRQVPVCTILPCMASSLRTNMNPELQNLFDLVVHEPTFRFALQVIEWSCLSKAISIKLDDKESNPAFAKHVHDDYRPFLMDAVSCWLMCGFVPWIYKKNSSDNFIPQVLPPGSFTWYIAAAPAKKRPRYSQPQALLQYFIHIEGITVDMEQIHIYVVYSPVRLRDSAHLSALYSPLKSLLFEYGLLRDAQVRRAYADEWNTTARMVTAFEPKRLQTDDVDKGLLETGFTAVPDPDEHMVTFQNMQLQYETRDAHISRTMQKDVKHQPIFYNLPKSHRLEATHAITPCEDITFLMHKFRQDVSMFLGIPIQLIDVGTDQKRVSKDDAPLISNMMYQCGKTYATTMQHLLYHVYTTLYPESNQLVSFELQMAHFFPDTEAENNDALAQLQRKREDHAMRIAAGELALKKQEQENSFKLAMLQHTETVANNKRQRTSAL